VLTFTETTLGEAINQFSEGDVVTYYDIVHLLEAEVGLNYKDDILALTGNKAVTIVRDAIGSLVKPGALIRSID
jgi:hypothetical protein